MNFFLVAIKRHWQIGLLAAVFFPVLIKLGFWQLTRADEKRQLLAVYQQQQNLPALLLENSHNTTGSYRNIIARGVFDASRYWLLDNRSRAGRVGYEVLMPLHSGDTTLLVNRGWVAAPMLRANLPDVDTPQDEVTVEGYLLAPQTNALLNNTDSDLPLPWPKRVLQVDLQRVASDLNTDVYPALLRINTDSDGALVTQWPLLNSSPEKHQGYALQWFAMAAALLVLYGLLIFKETTSTQDSA
ncbi:MAG: SURF1 family protein [Cellvibrionaceae bacterium]|nr:SURF1 family protein [Cellvibrionaceae bacterium]